ncbi:MAG: menaquinone biosynthesis protein [Phycisphaeraceae bacterium]|nr:menaquinone biosynthesis protein [Phycisphaeraceae bacterium]
MDQATPQSDADHATHREAATHRVGCVSYLNAKPLIAGLDDEPGITVKADVPARLLKDLESGEVDIALCPVFDFFKSGEPLALVPVGAIGCEGPTLTVRLYSQVPIDQVTTLHADTDSHTSVVLAQILLAKLFNVSPTMVDYDARERTAEGRIDESPQAMLLIGDKVVTGSPLAVEYPYQMDLGEGWHEMTGLPFVFAIWMTRAGTELGDLPARLQARLEANLPQRLLIAERFAEQHGWPNDLAEHYLVDVLRYQVGPLELEAISRFGRLALELGLIDTPRELCLYAETNQP